MTFVKVFVKEDGKHYLKLPSGEEIPGIVFTRVFDGLPDQQTYVIAKLLVELEKPEKSKS